MIAPRQFVSVVYRPGDTRSYTYHNDGEPFAAGDMVRVTDRTGTGWKKVYVVGVSADEPPYPTKPVIGRHHDEPPPGTLDLGDADRANALNF